MPDKRDQTCKAARVLRCGDFGGQPCPAFAWANADQRYYHARCRLLAGAKGRVPADGTRACKIFNWDWWEKVLLPTADAYRRATGQRPEAVERVLELIGQALLYRDDSAGPLGKATEIIEARWPAPVQPEEEPTDA